MITRYGNDGVWREVVPATRRQELGRAFGNWNDRHFGADTRHSACWIWRLNDRIAGWLYARGR